MQEYSYHTIMWVNRVKWLICSEKALQLYTISMYQSLHERWAVKAIWLFWAENVDYSRFVVLWLKEPLNADRRSSILGNQDAMPPLQCWAKRENDPAPLTSRIFLKTPSCKSIFSNMKWAVDFKLFEVVKKVVMSQDLTPIQNFVPFFNVKTGVGRRKGR